MMLHFLWLRPRPPFAGRDSAAQHVADQDHRADDSAHLGYRKNPDLN